MARPDKAVWLHLLVPYHESAETCVGYLGYRQGGRDRGALEVLEQSALSPAAVIEKTLAAAKAAGIVWNGSLVFSLPLDNRMALANQVLNEAQKRGAQFFREIPFKHAPAPGVLWRVRPQFPLPPREVALPRIRALTDAAKEAAAEPDYPTALTELLTALELAVPVVGWCELHTAVTVRMLSQMYRATGSKRNEQTALLLLRDMAAGIAATPADKIPQNDSNYRDFIDLLAEEAAALGDDPLRRQFRRHCVAAGGESRPGDEAPVEPSASDSKRKAMAELEDLLGGVMGMLPVDDLYSNDQPGMAAALGAAAAPTPATVSPPTAVSAPASAAAAAPRISSGPISVKDWFHVKCDRMNIDLDVAPPGLPAWKATISYAEIFRIVYKCEDHHSDGIYLFTPKRDESYAVPTEADGGAALIAELLDRAFFPADLLIQASTAPAGTIFRLAARGV